MMTHWWSIPYFVPFKDVEVAERFANSRRKAGLQ